MRRLSIFMAAGLAATVVASGAWAQQVKTPYQFGGSSGVGMSTAYRQAIINAEVTGQHPDNLLRGPRGNLLTVTEAADGRALVSRPQSQFLPGRRTSGLQFDSGIGVRFATGTGASGGTSVAPPPRGDSAVDGWTRQVHGMAAPGTGQVDAWVAQAYTLPPLGR